jgi:hypothetical protein
MTSELIARFKEALDDTCFLNTFVSKADLKEVIAALEAMPAPLAHGHRSDWYLMANARRIVDEEWSHRANWALASELFATGSTSARQICIDAGIDPEATEVSRPSPPTQITG